MASDASRSPHAAPSLPYGADPFVESQLEALEVGDGLSPLGAAAIRLRGGADGVAGSPRTP